MKYLPLLLSFLFLSCNPSHVVHKPTNKKDIFSSCILDKTESNNIVGLAYYKCNKKVIIAAILFSKDGSLSAFYARRMIKKNYSDLKSMKIIFMSYIIGKDSKNFPFMLFSIDPT